MVRRWDGSEEFQGSLKVQTKSFPLMKSKHRMMSPKPVVLDSIWAHFVDVVISQDLDREQEAGEVVCLDERDTWIEIDQPLCYLEKMERKCTRRKSFGLEVFELLC